MPRRRRQRRRASQPQTRLHALGMVELLDSTDDEEAPTPGPSSRRQRTQRSSADRYRLAGRFPDTLFLPRYQLQFNMWPKGRIE